MSKNSYFSKAHACKAPWISLSIRNGNRLSICSNSGFSAPMAADLPLSVSMNSKELQDYRLQHFNQTPLSSCAVCVQRSELNLRAQRHALNELPAEPDLNLNLETIDPAKVVLLDMNLSNICNLKCRMCSSLRSSSWKDDQKILSQELSFVPPPNQNVETYNNVDLETFTNLKYFILKGGEPLFDRSSLKIIERLVSLGRSREITLTIFTNGVFVRDNLKLLKEFKRLNLIFSFEGTGELYSYIRGGKILFSDLYQSIEAASQYENIFVSFMYTPQAYNIFDMSKALEFIAYKINPILRNKLDSQDLQITFGNILHYPYYLKISALPDAVRQEALNVLKQSKVYSLIDWNPIELLLRQAHDPDAYSKFVSYTKKLDEIRGDNLFTVVPEFEKLKADFAR
jgi:hypothetical protein